MHPISINPVFNKLYSGAFSVMNLHKARKAQLMAILAVLLSVLLMLTTKLVTSFDFGQGKNLDVGFVQALPPYIVAYIALCLLAFALGFFKPIKRSQYIDGYVTTVLCIYTLGNIGFVHLFGELSLWTGVLAAGTPIVGWILFDTRSVLIAYAVGTGMSVILYILAYLGVLEYAPIVTQKQSLHTNTAWLIVIYAVGIPHVFCLLLLAHISIKHWRSREERVRYMACTDELTNISNRRHFMAQMEVEINRLSRKGLPISVLMIDIDHFKKINDSYGHLVGDEVIQKTALVLAKSLRKADLVGRLGGEEFCIALPETDQENAMMVAQRCRRKIAETDFTDEGIKATVSVGVSTFSVNTSISDETLRIAIIAAADEALYQSKAQGRDRVSYCETRIDGVEQA